MPSHSLLNNELKTSFSLHIVFSTSIREPAIITFSFAGNPAPFGVSDTTPEVACSIILVTRSLAFFMIRCFPPVDDSEIIGSVFITTVRVPACTLFSFAGNSSPLGVCDSTPEVACSIILITSGTTHDICLRLMNSDVLMGSDIHILLLIPHLRHLILLLLSRCHLLLLVSRSLLLHHHLLLLNHSLLLRFQVLCLHLRDLLLFL